VVDEAGCVVFEVVCEDGFDVDQTVVKDVPDPVSVDPDEFVEVLCVSEPDGSVGVSDPVEDPEGSLETDGSVTAELPSVSDGSVSEATGSVDVKPVLSVGPVCREVPDGSVRVAVVGVIG